MSFRVLKYRFEIKDIIELQLPEHSELLHVNIQHGFPCCWARVPLDNDPVLKTYRIRCAGTGHAVTEPTTRYLGTILLHGGDIVLHFFEMP